MKQIKGIVFDLYGTLYDVHSVASRCSRHFPGRGLEISMLWRQKQLEYTWLRSLMGQYISFEQATEDALRFVAEHLKLELSDDVQTALCHEYLNINPYPEVPASLEKLQSLRVPLAILSNGSVNSIRSVVGHSGLTDRFDHLISVADVQIFKPHRSVYELAENKIGLHRSEILFVSSNSWDAAGAHHFGFQVCWVNRNGNAFEELGQHPDHVVGDLSELPDIVRLAPATL